jgi:hypothetical protein
VVYTRTFWMLMDHFYSYAVLSILSNELYKESMIRKHNVWSILLKLMLHFSRLIASDRDQVEDSMTVFKAFWSEFLRLVGILVFCLTLLSPSICVDLPQGIKLFCYHHLSISCCIIIHMINSVFKVFRRMQSWTVEIWKHKISKESLHSMNVSLNNIQLQMTTVKETRTTPNRSRNNFTRRGFNYLYCFALL